LAKRTSLTAYLADRATLLCNLDELAGITEELIVLLEQDSPFLVETGHSQLGCRRARWLETRLTRLYPVKLPMEVSVIDDRQGERVYAYAWPDKVAEILPARPPFRQHSEVGYHWKDDGTAYTADGSPVSRCAYKDAALIKGLDPADAACLEAGRATFLRLKIAILKELLNAIRWGTADRLWERCLHLLTQALTAKDVDFYLSMDRFYSGFDLKTGMRMREAVDIADGGLTALFMIIGYYEKELTVGTLAQTRDALGSLVQLDQLSSPHLAIDNYFQAIARRERKTLDIALNVFQSRDNQEQAFWRAYSRRIHKALEEEFYENLMIPIKVKRKDVPQFEPHMSMYANWLRSHLERSGHLPQVALSEATRLSRGHQRQVTEIRRIFSQLDSGRVLPGEAEPRLFQP
jgi:hypothetical protein